MNGNKIIYGIRILTDRLNTVCDLLDKIWDIGWPIFKLWVIFSIMQWWFSSCTPERRLARLLKNHPELVKRDTIFVEDTTELPAIKVDTLLDFFTDTLPYDSIINSLRGKVTEGRIDTIRQAIHTELAKTISLRDTKFRKGKVNVRIRSAGGKIRLQIDKPKELSIKKRAILVNEIKPRQDKEEVVHWLLACIGILMLILLFLWRRQ